MKLILILACSLLCILPGYARSMEQPDIAPELEYEAPTPAMVKEQLFKVYYSFDHYADNPKMYRSFVSEELIKAAVGSGELDSSVWDITSIASRLTGVLMMHTHSVSTTKSVRKDLERVKSLTTTRGRTKVPLYERLKHSRWGDEEIVAFCHRSKGNTIDELLVFKFRDNYCSRVIQLTGKLRPDDITKIIRKK